MACHHPIPAYLGPGGKVHFANRKDSFGRLGLMHLRCGMCRGCKADHAREWAIRCYHESQLHNRACFITLTYSTEKLPANSSLDKRDLSLFFKRLRDKLDVRIRYFACGEYGEKKGRPHYHVCLFGWRPDNDDKLLVAISKKGNRQYGSKIISKCWGLGRAVWTNFDSSCARYTAHYTADKIKGLKKDEPDPETGLRPYEIIDRDGVIWKLCPEFQVSSLKPAIGLPWLEKNYREVFPADSVVMDGREYPPPRYYFQWLKKNVPALYEKVAKKRREHTKKRPYETGLRQLQKNQSREKKLDLLVRPTHKKDQS